MTLIVFPVDSKVHEQHFKYSCYEVLTHRKFSKAPQSLETSSNFVLFTDLETLLLPLFFLGREYQN